MRGRRRTQKTERNRQHRVSVWSVGLLLRAQGGGWPHPFCRWFDWDTFMLMRPMLLREAELCLATDRVFPKPHVYCLGLYRFFFCFLAPDTGCSKRNDSCPQCFPVTGQEPGRASGFPHWYKSQRTAQQGSVHAGGWHEGNLKLWRTWDGRNQAVGSSEWQRSVVLAGPGASSGA